jgi:hypothetical protein
VNENLKLKTCNRRLFITDTDASSLALQIVKPSQYGDAILIRGENPYPRGDTADIFTLESASNIATFHKNIIENRFNNTTAEPRVQSNLITILGRTAAYENCVITGGEMMTAAEKLKFKAGGAKDDGLFSFAV